MVFIFYALSVVLMLLVRPWLAQHFLPKHGKMSIYAALYFFPTLALIQAVFGGLICEYNSLTFIYSPANVVTPLKLAVAASGYLGKRYLVALHCTSF
jgi:hypothetical protein